MNYKELQVKLKKYKDLNRKLEELELKNSDGEADKVISESFDALGKEIKALILSTSFRAVLKNLCYMYSGLLSVCGGSLAYRGTVPSPIKIDCDTVFAVSEQCKNDIMSSLKLLSQKSADAEKNISIVCTAFVTLRNVLEHISEWEKRLIEAEHKKILSAIENIKNQMLALEREFPELKTPGDAETVIENTRCSVSEERNRFRFENIKVVDNYAKSIRIPVAYNPLADEFESGVICWEPTRDGILHVEIHDGKFELATDFIKGIIMQFLYAYPLMKKQVLYCCQQSLSEMDIFLGALKEICLDSVFFNGIEQFNASTFYHGVGDCMKNLRSEARRRASLIDSKGAASIYEYNAMDDVDVLSPILVVIHDYPNGFSGCVDLGYFFRECARFGIFCAVIQTRFEGFYAESGACDPDQFRSLRCRMISSSRLNVGGAACDSVMVDKRDIRRLLMELMENAEKGRKNKYLSYEDIGFDQIERNTNDGCTKVSIPVGKINNEVFSMDFATSTSDEDQKKGIKSPIAYLVVGGPGSGKSTLIDALVINGSMAYSPEDLTFYLMDFKDGITASFYDGENAIPHVRMIASRSKEEDSDIILNGLLTEKERRNELFKSVGAGDIAGYISRSGEKIPRIIVIVDECQNLFASDILSEKCERLAREGRSSGIHLVLASQDAKYDMMKHAGKFIDGRFCFYMPEKDDAAQVIGASFVNNLNVDVPKGSGLAWMSLDSGATCEKIRIAFHGGDKSGNKAEFNRLIREKWAKQGFGVNLIKAGDNSPLVLSHCNENPLLSDAPSIAILGEDYFDHNPYKLDLSNESARSILILGNDEKVSSDILTSLTAGALATGGEIKLIDESIDLSLYNFFGSHPSVTPYSKADYLTALKEIKTEFDKRNDDPRASYKPYFVVVSSLHRINDYYNNKKMELGTNVELSGDIASIYAQLTANTTNNVEIKGKDTLLSMLKEIRNVPNMHIIVADSTNYQFDYDERQVFSTCGYKMLQKDIGSLSLNSIITESSFREKMVEGLADNIVFVANNGQYSKCRYLQYDWSNNVTQDRLVFAIKHNAK